MGAELRRGPPTILLALGQVLTLLWWWQSLEVVPVPRPGKSFKPLWQQILRHDFLLPTRGYQVVKVTKFFATQPKFGIVVVVAANRCLSVSS